MRWQHRRGHQPSVGRREEESEAGSGGARLIVPPQRDLEVECTAWKWAGF